METECWRKMEVGWGGECGGNVAAVHWSRKSSRQRGTEQGPQVWGLMRWVFLKILSVTCCGASLPLVSCSLFLSSLPEIDSAAIASACLLERLLCVRHGGGQDCETGPVLQQLRLGRDK